MEWFMLEEIPMENIDRSFLHQGMCVFTKKADWPV